MFSILMKKATDNDAENGHIEMDDLMCTLLRSLGYGDGVNIFENFNKWYA